MNLFSCLCMRDTRQLLLTLLLLAFVDCAFAQAPGSGQYCAMRSPSDTKCFSDRESAEDYLRSSRVGEFPGRHLLTHVKTEFEGSGSILWSYAIPPVEATYSHSEYDSSDSACRSALGRPCSSEGELEIYLIAACGGGADCQGEYRGVYFSDPPNWWYVWTDIPFEVGGLINPKSQNNVGSPPNRRYYHRQPPKSSASFRRDDIYDCPVPYRGGGKGYSWGWFAPLAWPVACYNPHQGFIRFFPEQYLSCPQDGNPCVPATGAKEARFEDFDWNGHSIARAYNSLGHLPTAAVFGKNWFGTFSQRLYPPASGNARAYLVSDQGRFESFVWNSGAKSFYSENVAGTLLRRGSGEEAWLLREASGNQLVFDAQGRLLRSGLGRESVRLSYCEAADVSAGLCEHLGTLRSVIDAAGRELRFDYSDEWSSPVALANRQQYRLTSISDTSGIRVRYHYDEQARLVGVEYPTASGSSMVEYRYAEPSHMCRLHNGALEANCDPVERASVFREHLTGIIDENGVRTADYTYDSRGRVTQSQHAGNAKRVSLDYLSASQVRVTQPEGGSRLYTFSTGRFRKLLSSVEETTDGSVTGTTTHNINTSTFRRNYTVDARGTRTNYTHDSFRETGRTEALAANGATTPLTRSYTSTWDNTLNRMLTRTEPGREIRFAYNSRGQTTARCEVDLSLPAAVAYTQCGSAANAPVGVRQTTYTYCEEPEASAPGSTCPIVGALKSVDGPRVDVADVTTYAYHAATDESGCDQASGACHRRGDLHTVTNALGHVTTHARYDRAGRLTRSIDANGVVTELNYHPRGWLLSRTIKGATAADDATTRFAYAPTGLVSRITQADGSYLDYGYDDAHRLISVTDALGNRIDYTLDPAGNRTAETTFDPQGAVKRQLSRVYNQLGQLREQRDAQLRAYVSEYDANGNSTASTDPLNVRSTQSFDPLNRLQQSLQDVGGLNVSTGYQYDAQDRLTKVIDPKGLHTDYSYSGLGDLTQLSSPDTGVTTYTVDAAGNRLTQTDARGVTVTMQYDALNRLIHQANSQDGEQIVYRYDGLGDSACGGTSYALGRLSQIEDALGTLTYCYDRRGNVIAKHRAPASASSGTPAWSLQYSYSRADQLLSLRYPNGLELHYGRDAAGRVQSVSYRQGGALQPLISAIDYAPFGPALRLQYANGSEWTRSLDADYRIQRIAAPGLEVDFGLDAVGNIIALDQGSQQHTIDYDALYRLQALRAGTSDIEGFSYDATGNRLSYSQPAVTQSYSYPSNSHRLDAINGASRSYTAAGNTSAVNGLSLDYSGFNRLSRVANNGLDLQRAHYNGRGEREHRWTASAPRYFGYDEGGRLLFEGDSATGALRQLFVWLDDQPVALLPQAGAYAGEVLHVHADHLGSPRVVTRPTAGNATVWRWALEGSAFGQHPAEADVDGDGVALEFNLRYPGQYYDSATGWHYNYFRDYEPATGRYVQSDPIGLEGGVGIYVYSFSNPLLNSDPSGLIPGWNPGGSFAHCGFSQSGCANRLPPAPNPLRCVGEWRVIDDGIMAPFVFQYFICKCRWGCYDCDNSLSKKVDTYGTPYLAGGVDARLDRRTGRARLSPAPSKCACTKPGPDVNG